MSSEARKQSVSTRRRVIIGATVLGLGGIRTHLVLLCQLLRRHGVDVTVFATGSHWDEETLARLRNLGVKFRLPPAFARRSRKLSTLYCCLAWPFLLRRPADSVYCISAGYSQILLHRLKPRGAVSVNHEIVEPPGAESMAGKCAARLDATVANSEKVAQIMKGFWPEKPMRVIPFLTADGPTPPPKMRRRLGAGDEMRVVYLGRLVEQKRPDHLVHRWKALGAKPGLAPARLDIYGYDPDGRMLAGLRDFVGEANLERQVTVHGEYALADLPRILDSADLVVLPSLWEGLPLVLVEAMLRGVPFVATAAGGTAELGKDNPDACITSTDWADFEAGLVSMAQKLRAGEVDPARLHQWAEERYGYAAVSRQWLRCLCEPREFYQRT
jgi:glycosyltransferase involved in cell wall biosynthesis